jgi:hypothetical protein
LGRLHHLLSDHELLVMGFATMVPGIIDIREQFPLALEAHSHELGTYRVDYVNKVAPGTLDLAAEMGIRHPRLGATKDANWWVMTTDLLLTIQDAAGTRLLAISVKYDNDLPNTRTRQLLTLEQEYWRRQSIDWLLITPSTYEAQVGLTMVHLLPWGLSSEVLNDDLLSRCRRLMPQIHGARRQQAIKLLADDIGCSDSAAQFAFWRAVWNGTLPLDLSVRMDANAVMRVIAKKDFLQKNPITGGRSAWQQ